jgi:hypothetical protein
MSDERRYDYFKFQLPEKSAQHYANNALKILKDIKHEFPELFRVFRVPSEVLTLSGVRAFDAYNQLGRVDAATKNGIKALLKQHNILLVEDTVPVLGGSNRDNLFMLVNFRGLNAVPKSYGYIPSWPKPVIRHMQTGQDFLMWWTFWKLAISQELIDDKQLPGKDWLHDGFVSHNIAFGMLLGYPGEAIVSCLWGESKSTMEIWAYIKHARQYVGPQPVYSYHEQLKDNPHITAHEKLWSDILTIVYKDLKKL